MTALANDAIAELLDALDRRCAKGQPLTPAECGAFAAELRGALLLRQVSDACEVLDRAADRLQAVMSAPLPVNATAQIVPFPRRLSAGRFIPTGGDDAA